MAAMELLSNLLEINTNAFTKVEIQLLEIELFLKFCEELKKYFWMGYAPYFELIKNQQQMENEMLNLNLVKHMVNDILATEEYSLRGIASYTQVPKDVVYDLAIGKNNNPSLLVSRKILELHRLVKPDLYKSIGNRIAVEYAALNHCQNNLGSLAASPP